MRRTERSIEIKKFKQIYFKIIRTGEKIQGIDGSQKEFPRDTRNFTSLNSNSRHNSTINILPIPGPIPSSRLFQGEISHQNQGWNNIGMKIPIYELARPEIPTQNRGRDNIGMKIPIAELAPYARYFTRVSRSHALTSQ